MIMRQEEEGILGDLDTNLVDATKAHLQYRATVSTRLKMKLKIQGTTKFRREMGELLLQRFFLWLQEAQLSCYHEGDLKKLLEICLRIIWTIDPALSGPLRTTAKNNLFKSLPIWYAINLRKQVLDSLHKVWKTAPVEAEIIAEVMANELRKKWRSIRAELDENRQPRLLEETVAQDYIPMAD
jgi:hypothetical protein